MLTQDQLSLGEFLTNEYNHANMGARERQLSRCRALLTAYEHVFQTLVRSPDDFEFLKEEVARAKNIFGWKD
jgi:hypothetical protein